jgi:hypothetical protein
VKLAWWLLAITPLFAQVKIYLNDLQVVNDRYETHNGGLFFSNTLNLQAQNISFDQKKGVLEASENLLFILNGQIFVAKSLFIDLTTQTGYFEDLTFKINSLYIQAKKTELDENKSITFERVEITPFDQPPLLFSFQVLKGSVDQQKNLEAQTISAQLIGAPVFFLPKIKWNLDQLPSKGVRYFFMFNQGQNPLFSFRYPILSEENYKALFRFDYRIAKGFGTAVETQVKANHDRIKFWTQNFFDYDTFFNDNNTRILLLRYRFKGVLDAFPKDEDLNLKFQYDVQSDRNLRLNFYAAQFEARDVMRTEGVLGLKKFDSENFLAFRPRANTYESFSQQLPSLKVQLDPIVFKPLGLHFNNTFDLSYQDYTFSDNLLQNVLPFHAGRLQTTQRLDLPLYFGPLKIEPDGLFSAIYYNNTPLRSNNTLVYFNYGIRASTILDNGSPQNHHVIQPYIDFHAYSTPTISKNERYIFSLYDGIYQIQELKTGILQTLTFESLQSTCTWDLVGLNFFDQSTFNVAFPKLKSFFTVETPWCTFKNIFGYNFQKNSIDLFNLEWGWTFKKDFAFHLDWLYRGPFEWKKDDKENYQLDMAYPIDTLALTPLSDRRNTFISRLEWHFFPNWTVRFEHHNGFWRSTEPPYLEFRASISTIYRSSLDINLSVIKSVNDVQVLFSLNLV